jgi:outer membrane protein insertion porin family
MKLSAFFTLIFIFMLFPGNADTMDFSERETIGRKTTGNTKMIAQNISDNTQGVLTGVIKAIEVEGLSRIDDDELIDLVSFEIGERLDMDSLRKGIRRAFRKKIFIDIRVFSEPYQGGIKLRYVVQEMSLVNKILIRGNERVANSDLKDHIVLKRGDDFNNEMLNGDLGRLLAFYDRKGFTDARVEVRVIATDKPALVNVEFDITEGDPLIIESIDAPVEAGYVMKTVAFSVFDREILDKDVENLRKYYRKQKYLRPAVGPYSFLDGVLTLPVERGPLLRVDFINNKAIRDKELRKSISFMEEGKVTDEVIEDAVERIRSMYVKRGYYHASVAAAVEEKEEIHVSFFIHEGEKVILEEISFEGMNAPLKSVIKLLSLKKGKLYNDNLLSDDIEALKKYYQSRGHLNMDVEDVKRIFQKEGASLKLHFVINEGPQVIIRAIKIIGNQAIRRKKLREVIRIADNSPLNFEVISDARYGILALYKRNGYANASVNVESTIDDNMADVVFTIMENSKHIIGKLILQGNNKTKAKIITRELTFEEGEFYNYDEILKVKQRLYRLGIFNEVSVDAIDTGMKINGNSVKDILISLKEGNPGTVEFSFGYGDYERLRGMFDINYSNLGGYNRQVGFKTELSAVEERYVFHLREPWLFNRSNLPFRVFLSREDTRAINIDTREVLYKIDKLGFLAGVEQEITKKLKSNLFYEYSFTETTDVEEGVILSKEDTGTLGISSVSPSLYYDTRDNPLNPTSGSFQSIVVKLASRAFLSEVGFVKTTFKSLWFIELHKGIIFAFSIGGGVAFSFEDTRELPLVERYFLGGSTTVRGYEHDSLGPKGEDDFPTGGNIFALVNSEIRIPLWKGIGLVTFVDGGNIWKTSSDINEDLRYTVGAGLRYKTPVGPVRLDYGHKISRREDESAGEVHFSFGHAF